MRLRNPLIQLVVALAFLLILVSGLSLSKIWFNQSSANVPTTSPTGTHQAPPIVSEESSCHHSG